MAYAQASLRQRQELRRQAAARAAGSREAAAQPAPAPPTALEQAENELNRLRARYQDSHPEVERMTAEVRRLRQEEAAQPASAGSPRPLAAGTPAHSASAAEAPPARPADEEPETSRIQELGAQISVVKQEIRSLEERRMRVLQDVTETQARVRNLPVREQQLAEITRDYETSRVNYQSLLNKKLAADVAADMERWHKSQKFVMLDPARVPQKPTRPRRMLLIAMGALFSTALGGGLGFLLELKKNALLGEWELPSDTVVIGRIPRMKLQSI
jgi:hypothetical protein